MAGRESDASRVQRVIIYVPKMSLAGALIGTTDQSTGNCFTLRKRDSSNKPCAHGWNFYSTWSHWSLLSQGPDPEPAVANVSLSINLNTLGVESEVQKH